MAKTDTKSKAGQQSPPNQSEGEFFALEKTGRDGVKMMIDRMHDEIIGAAAAQVQQQPSVWMQRAFLSVVNNDNLKDVLGHKRGIYSIYKAFAKAAQMGIQLGGQFPHAYLIPFKNKDNGYRPEAEMIVTAEGYRFAACHGSQPVLRDAIFRPVYEGDDVAIDQGKGEVSHRVTPGKERGKLLGVYGKLERPDGSTLVEWVPIEDIHAVRDNHSLAWQKGWDTAWKTDPEAMAMKTAAKRILKRYAAESEGLAMLMAADAEAELRETAPREPRDVTDRTTDRLEKRIGGMTPPAEPEPEPEEEQPASGEEPAEQFEEDAPEQSTGGDDDRNELF
ncbi:MAG: recombinase RecT [Spirochaetota bacterium]